MATVAPYAQDVAAILAAERTASNKAQMLLDRFTALPSAAEREAFVLALAGEVLVARAQATLEAALHEQRQEIVRRYVG